MSEQDEDMDFDSDEIESDDEMNENVSVKPLMDDFIKVDTHSALELIDFEDYVFDCEFNPTANLLAACSVNGTVSIISYHEEQNKHHVVSNLYPGDHTSCRSLSFHEGGSEMACVGKGGLFVYTTDNKSLPQLKWSFTSPESDLNVVKYWDPNTIVAGSTTGAIQMWDTRSDMCVSTLTDFSEPVSSFAVPSSRSLLLACAGDQMAAFDLRKALTPQNIRNRALYAMSDEFSVDITAMCLAQNDSIVLLGMANGKVGIMKWDDFGFSRECLDGFTEGVGALCCLPNNSDLFLGACEDGYVRLARLKPNKMIGILCEHEADRSAGDFGCQCMSIDRTGKILATSGANGFLEFHSLKDADHFAERKLANPKATTANPSLNFFSDL